MMLKKIAIAAFALFIVNTALTAQTIGLRVGLNNNNVATTAGISSIAPNSQAINQFNIGVFTDIPVANNFSIQPEVNLMWKGFALSEGFDAALFGINVPFGASVETKFQYIEVPLLAKYTFGEQALKAYVAAGPTISYATKGRVDTKATVLFDIPVSTTPLDLDAINYNRFELGAAIGAGVQADVGPVSAFVDIRYQHGFSQLYDIPLTNEKLRNQGFGVSLGFAIPMTQ